MEMVHSHKTLFQLCFLLPLQFSSFLLFSLAYTDPDKYFINCGASSDTKLSNGQVFVADRNSASFSTGKSEHVSNTSTWIPELYQTARVYRQPCSYRFEIDQNGTYIVRLHFFAYLSRRANLYDALFNVSASGFSLLTNFSIRNSSGSPVIKEFLLAIPQGDFRIQFIPSENSSLAFVNAIEVFLANETRITDNATRVTSAGNAGNYKGLLSRALHTIHRINFGGSQIDYDESYWRKWAADGSYLILNNDSAVNSTYYPTRPNYYSSLATNYTAPDYVYQTAKQLKEVSGKNARLLNLTWRFPVSKNTSHFVRVHFCDIVFKTLNDTMFNLYIYSNFDELVDPYNMTRTGEFAVPFFIDYVVDSDDSGFMNFSISPSENESRILNAFLNGLEIMEFVKTSGSILDECKPVKKLSPVIKIIGSVGSGAFMIVIIVVALRLKCRKSVPDQSLTKLLFGGLSFNRLTEGSANSSLPSNLNLSWRISLAEIQFATKNFNAKLLIGEGGFGKVYKGTLHNGTRVAVKRSEAGHGQGIEEFQTEIIVLSQIRHQHLVSLIGYCDERSEMILVYEFMEKGTLREHLYHSNDNSETISSPSELSWKQRLEICIGAATGLRYLHTGPAGGIIHRDVKSTNILLDENFVAKVADFGLSKSGVPDPEHLTMAVKGSFGYLDPEYLTTLQLTEKSDVYSFGVVLLEILCARPAINNLLPLEEMNLAEWGMLWRRKGQLEKIIDPVLVGKIKPSSLRKFGETAEKCLKTNSAERPKMHEVLYDLQYALMLQETAMHADPGEDSTINTSLQLQIPLAWQLPSDGMLKGEDDHTPIGGDDDSDISASESQNRIED
ncbi:probable receptor-like protein kinase At5g24010 isoform X3 [Quercus robur]|uniref:probable receptor-like protein kinase At5g24010 isoform X3 n=1 Tax=Quercus robur TaxID=38942 RepID=UPI002163EE3B|nr:probable receptor-like protein kinase At5g24010 isoform X3 [Quercus robur]